MAIRRGQKLSELHITARFIHFVAVTIEDLAGINTHREPRDRGPLLVVQSLVIDSERERKTFGISNASGVFNGARFYGKSPVGIVFLSISIKTIKIVSIGVGGRHINAETARDSTKCNL